MVGRDPVWIVTGALGAIALGVILIPVRALTAASNLAFVFLVLTIIIAEVGGRAAGLATAVVAALSLNFFLTQPHLTLTIDRADDLVAFIALAVSGLVAAAFGRRRARSSELLDRVRHDLDGLARIADTLLRHTPLDQALDELRHAFKLGGAVVREASDRLVAATPPDAAAWPTPVVALDPRELLGDQRYPRLGRRGLRLPEGGGRLRLASDPEPRWLDLWEGDEEGFSLDEHRALAVAVAILRLALRPGSTPGARPT